MDCSGVSGVENGGREIRGALCVDAVVVVDECDIVTPFGQVKPGSSNQLAKPTLGYLKMPLKLGQAMVTRVEAQRNKQLDEGP